MKPFVTLFALLLAAVTGIRPLAAADVAVLSGKHLDNVMAEIQVESGVTVILIPGILGSKLTLKNGGQTTLIWGGSNTNDANLLYDPSQNVEPAFFDGVEIDAFLTKFKYNVYGHAVVDIRDSSPDGRTRVEIFPYDWRQSNIKSAERLQRWICERAGKLKGRKVIFAAHSMGGLVLKAWLLKHYDQNRTCGDVPLHELLDISQLIFVGTPHAGAPIFIRALVDQYELVKDYPIIDKFLTWGLNAYGSSFESIYELLPIVQSADCRKKKKIDKPEYIYLSVPGQAPKSVELFRAQQWRDLKIPKRRHINDDDKFYNEFLPPQLARAEKLLCDLWQYDFGVLRGKVMSIYGTDKGNTVAKYVLARFRNVSRAKTLWERANLTNDEIVIDIATNGYGDGTVPKEIAETAPEDKFAHRAYNSHQSLLDDEVFRDKLSKQIDESKLAIVRRASIENPAKEAVVTQYAKAYSKLIPASTALAMTDIFKTPSPELAWAVRINTAVLAQHGIDLKNLPALAKNSADETVRAEIYAQIIADNSAPIAKRISTANNLGHLLLTNSKFYQAAQILVPAASALQSLPAGQFDNKLAGKLLKNTGWTALKNGELDAAEAYFTDAKSFGEVSAKFGLKQVDIMRSAAR